MAEKTGISWCTSSWNPWIGCSEISPGCDNCYARELDKRHRFGGGTHWGAGAPRYRTKSWRLPLTWNRKAAASGERWTVFPSLCDPFDNEVPEEWRHDFFRLIADTPALTWLLLTKRIGNVEKMLPSDFVLFGRPAHNVWIGASVVNQEEANRDIPKLRATPAVVRFISYEPALSVIDWTGLLDGISQVIVGGESRQGGAQARPFNIGWAHSTISQCRAAGVACFVKQLGSKCITNEQTFNPVSMMLGVDFIHSFKDRAGANPTEWPTTLRVQEFPNVELTGSALLRSPG